MSRNVEKNIANINQELGRIKEEVIRTARHDSLHREISNFKSDLDAIKGLLLNRFVYPFAGAINSYDNLCM